MFLSGEDEGRRERRKERWEGGMGRREGIDDKKERTGGRMDGTNDEKDRRKEGKQYERVGRQENTRKKQETEWKEYIKTMEKS